MEFKDKLKELRNKKGVSQAKLAEMLSVTPGAVAHWELGNRQPDYTTLIKISSVLDIDPNTLLGWVSLTKELQVQRINLNYIFKKSNIIDTTIIPLFEKYFEYFSSKNGWTGEGPYVHSVDELIVRYQDLYNKVDLISYEEQKDFNSVLNFSSYDLLDMTTNNLKIQWIIDFIDNPEQNTLIQSNDGMSSSDILHSCIEAERFLKIERLFTDSEKQILDIMLDNIDNIFKETSISLYDNYFIELNRFLSVIYTPVGIYDYLDKKQSILNKFKLYENPVSAGLGTWLDEGTEYNYIEIEHTEIDADFALKVRGDSMSPMYNDGDIVFVKSLKLIEPGQIGVFLINGEGYLKQWQGNRLLSLNPQYEPITINENDEFMAVGKVVDKLSK